MGQTHRGLLLDQLAIAIADFSDDELNALTEYILALQAGTVDSKERDESAHPVAFNNQKKEISK